MKKLSFRLYGALLALLLISFSLSSCQGGSDDSASEATPSTAVLADQFQTPVIKEVDALKDYEASSFSKDVYFGKSGDSILLGYNFFPQGTDFQTKEKKVTLPCEPLLPEDSLISFSLSAPLDGGVDCEGTKVLTLTAATFELGGMKFSFTGVLETFSQDFGFLVKSGGFVDSMTREFLSVPFDPDSVEEGSSTLEMILEELR
jgi:hypothetical protein